MDNNIRRLIEKLKEDIDKNGLDAVKELLSNENYLSNNLSDKKDIEYIKQMIFSQFNVHGMLIDHKYYEFDKVDKSQIMEYEAHLYRKIDSNGKLLFNKEEVESILGNPLNIKSEEEYKGIEKYFYNTYSFSTFDKMYETELDKLSIANCKNPFKKMALSRRIRKNEKHYSMQGPYAQIIIKMIKEEMKNNLNINRPVLSNIINQKMGRYILESSKCFEAVDIVKMTLTSLLTEERKPINIEEACKSYRRELGSTYSEMDKKTDYREIDTVLGFIGPKIKNIDYRQIPKEMQKLQLEYMDAYENSKSEEEYIRRVTRIFGKFVFLQPFEDCNKRTGICLLNAMLQSKGIRPVPFSLTHSRHLPYEMVKKAYDIASTREYGPLEDVMVAVFKKEGQLIQKDVDGLKRPKDKLQDKMYPRKDAKEIE